jgi:hypothetical protein
MRKHDHTELLGGLLLVAIGLGFAFYAARYNFGTMTRMGPGFFPTVLGYMLASVGVLVGLAGLNRPGGLPVMHWRAFFTILIAVSAFALTLRPFGMVPATFVLVGLAALAQHEVRLVPTLVLAASLSVIAVLVFVKGLGVLVPIFSWPF